MPQKIIVSGCSFSYTPVNETYSKCLSEIYGYKVTNISRSGRSNQSIIKSIYDFVNFGNIKNSYIICQLTFTHRFGMFHDVLNEWYDYQPYGINMDAKLNTKTMGKESYLKEFDELRNGELSNEIGNDLLKFYETYLKWIYNDDAEFESLMLNVDMFNEWAKLNNNKIVFLYWPDLNDNQITKLKQRNFFNIDGNYSMFEYTKNNGLVDIDGHMNKEGHMYIADKLNKWITK